VAALLPLIGSCAPAVMSTAIITSMMRRFDSQASIGLGLSVLNLLDIVPKKPLAKASVK